MGDQLSHKTYRLRIFSTPPNNINRVKAISPTNPSNTTSSLDDLLIPSANDKPKPRQKRNATPPKIIAAAPARRKTQRGLPLLISLGFNNLTDGSMPVFSPSSSRKNTPHVGQNSRPSSMDCLQFGQIIFLAYQASAIHFHLRRTQTISATPPTKKAPPIVTQSIFVAAFLRSSGA